jgi:hypothetical protein
MNTIVRFAFNLTLVAGLYGCASKPPVPSEQPPALSAAKPSAQPSAQPSASGSADVAAPEPAPSGEPTPKDEGLRKASRPPSELISISSVLYVFNFAESEVGKKAKEECQASAADQVSACLQKARSKVPVESIRFKKTGTEYFWITLNRYKGNLMKWHVIQYQVGEQTNDRVTLKPMGKDKGIAPMAKIPRTLEIELPNDYSIVVNDPEFGKMSFDAKIGAVDDD